MPSTINFKYEQFINDPLNIVGDMSYDEYMDWLDLGTKEDLVATLKKFESAKISQDYIKILKIKLNSL